MIDLTLRSEKSTPITFAEMDSNLQKLQDAVNEVDGVKNLKININNFQKVKGFYTGLSVGGGTYLWDATKPKTAHNGGTVLSPEALAAWDGSSSDILTLFNWVGSGNGCFVRLQDDVVHVTCFGALPTHLGGNALQNIPINKAIASFSGTFGIVKLPVGVFRVSDKIVMYPAVTLEGCGAEATWIERAPNTSSTCVVSAEFTGNGADYIYIKNLTVSGNKQNGGVGKGIIFDKVHVPSYLDDVTVLWCTSANLEIKNSTVIQLNRVWSNGSDSFALDVDTVRSLHIIGGAYEHCDGGTSHIRIRNTGNFYYPQATISGGHIEGLLLAGMSGIEIGGGSEYYSVQGLAINGLQILGKRIGGESNNYAIKLLDDNCEIAVNGASHTGITSFVAGTRVGVHIPPPSAFSISNWYYTGNTSSGYRMPSNVSTDSEGSLFKVISQQTVSVPAYSQTEQGIVIPTQPDTNYSVFVQIGGFMGANTTLIIPEADKTPTITKLRFVDSTTGTAKQLENLTTFKVLVTRK